MRNAEPTKRHRAAMWLLTACGVWLLGLGVYFIVLRPALLPEDPRFMGATLEQLRMAAPGLEGWLHIVFTVMGGYMVGAGVLHSDFRRVLVVPAVAWVAGITTYLSGD
jgi:hypothetical protein